MSTPKLNKVKDHLAEIAPDGITMPTPSLVGGWSEEVEADGKCHYFTISQPMAADATQVLVVSLCGRYQGEGRADELDDLDPLAPENCKDCRRLLLHYKGLI